VEKRQTEAFFDRIANHLGLNIISMAALKSEVDDGVYTKFADQPVEQKLASGVWGHA